MFIFLQLTLISWLIRAVTWQTGMLKKSSDLYSGLLCFGFVWNEVFLGLRLSIDCAGSLSIYLSWESAWDISYNPLKGLVHPNYKNNILTYRLWYLAMQIHILREILRRETIIQAGADVLWLYRLLYKFRIRWRGQGFTDCYTFNIRWLVKLFCPAQFI